jgi:hypothetical protein
MPSSKHWGDPEEDEYMDDEGNVLYYDRTGKLRKYKVSDLEYQQQIHYEDDH